MFVTTFAGGGVGAAFGAGVGRWLGGSVRSLGTHLGLLFGGTVGGLVGQWGFYKEKPKENGVEGLEESEDENEGYIDKEHEEGE